MQVTGEHLDATSPAKSSSWRFPIPNFPSAMREKIFPMLDLVLQAVVHLPLAAFRGT